MTAVAAPGGQNKSPERNSMKRLIAVLLASLIITPAFACGPMGGAPMTSGGGETKRQKWARKRLNELDNRREAYRAGRLGAKIDDLTRGPFGSSMPREDQDAIKRQYDDQQSQAAKRQRKKEQVETWMLKKELGDISPDELAALKQFLNKRRARVIKGQHP
jgi:hypothetical protein